MNYGKQLLFLTLLALYISVSYASPYRDLFKQVHPSVVVLHTFESVPTRDSASNRQMASVQGLGSGVLISDDGKILTAAHVVHLSDSIHVEFTDGSKTLAKVLASDPAADIALLKIEKIPRDAVIAPLGNSETVEVGDDIFIIGAPYGISHTLTVGNISGHRTSNASEIFQQAEFFQTDAAINQGNSGGPMFNLKGEVIGIVSHILSKSGGFEGLGFAVTVNTARNLLLDNKGVWTGMEGKILAGDIAKLFNVPQDAGLLVERVAQDSPAAKAGLQGGNINAIINNTKYFVGGDIILHVDNVQIDTGKNLNIIRKNLKMKRSNEKTRISILRSGKITELITVMEKRY